MRFISLKTKKKAWPYIVRIPGNIKRRILGSKRYTKQRDSKKKGNKK